MDNAITIKKQFDKHTKPYCVFGVLQNTNGLSIEKEMLQWLTPDYDVICVYQPSPGTLPMIQS